MSYNISDSAKASLAKERLDTRFRIGRREQDRLVEQVANLHIRDKLVPPTKMSIRTAPDGKPKLFYEGSEEGLGIHPHAMGQMCSVSGMPKTYASRLMGGSEWERELFDHNMNTLFHKGKYLDRSRASTRFLHRIVGTELRGFLSRNFNRHLASLPLLRGFVMACDKVGALPIEATTSSVRFSLKCYLPHIFEPVDGEFVAVGVTWSNSDFGAGRLKVAMTTMRISGGTAAVLSDVLSRVHIGSVIQDSDLEMSDVTAAKEVEAQVSAIHDTVSQQLSAEPVNRLVEAIAVAHEEQLPWSRLRTELGRLLQKTEMADVKKMLETGFDDILDLPPPGRTKSGEAIATRWWASNVVSWMATNQQNPDRKGELQQLAGDLLGKGAA